MATPAPRLPARVREDHAKQAGAAAAAIMTTAENAILALMRAQLAKPAVPAQMTRRKIADAAAVELGVASRRLKSVYADAVKQVTGETGPLPDAPSQVAAAVLAAHRDAGIAFGAVLAAAGAKGAWMPPPSSPYRKIVNKAQRGTGPGLPAARAALAAITERGLTGYTSPAGRRQPLAAYAQKATRTAVAQLARAPVMSMVTARREALLTKHTAMVTAAWNGAIAGLDPRDVVTAYQSDSRVTSTPQQPGLVKRWRQEAARAAMFEFLSRIYQSGRYAALTSALEAAVRDGMAEGQADAMALAAWRQGLPGFAIDQAFTAALSAQGSMSAERAAQEAATSLVGGVTADAARKLVSMTGEAISENDLAAAVARYVSGGDVPAVGRWTEETLWEAFGSGAVGLYRQAMGQFTGQGIEVDWNNDSSPCPACLENADGSPYMPYEVPAYPAHGHCRCWLSSDSRLPVSLLEPFLTAA